MNRMNPALPAPIATYFSAKSGQDTDAILACFAPSATVVDEGENRVITGREEIREWLDGPIAEYKLTTAVTDSSEKEGEIVVTALVSGNFPGSPIEFYYHFRLEGGLIERLVI
jgi:ketosteroid isomerase-like protein